MRTASKLTGLSALAILLAGPATIASAEDVVENDVPLFNPTGCVLPMDVRAQNFATELTMECRLLLASSESGTTVRIVPSPPEATMRELGDQQPTNCRDTIEKVRDANDQPSFDRSTASADEPLLIAAVDQRIDGCSVMVMHNDTSDVRPLPERGDGPLLRPAG